jgi:hypothetical protein
MSEEEHKVWMEINYEGGRSNIGRKEKIYRKGIIKEIV